MKLHRRFIADRAVRTHLVVVSTPSLAFSTCFVEAQEPVGIQAFGSELAVERLDEGIVSRFAWPTEVECHAFHVRPQIELLAHELGTVVDADRLGIAELCGAAFECFNDIVSTIVRIPINSPVYSDLISPGIPISTRSPFRFQIARGTRSFQHVDFLTLATVVGQPFLVCFERVRRMLSPASSMRWAL